MVATGPQVLEVNTPLSEKFERDGIIVTLEWSHENSGTLYSYYVTVVPSVEIVFIGRVKIQLKVSYDVLYNVSVVASSLCGQRNATTFTILHYGEY